MSAAALRVTDLSKSFGNVKAVQKVSLEARPGGAYGLIGPNGAGKSTFFDLINGVQLPDSGSVFVDDEELTGSTADHFARRGVMRTFQHTTVFPALTVRENLLVGGILVDGRRPLASLVLSRGYRRARRSLEARATEVLDLLGMSARSEDRAKGLSYGELRYLEVAIALMSRPRLLLLDEPAAGLNEQEAERLKEIFDMLIADDGVTTIVVEHNVGLVMRICEQVWVLHHGELIAAGSPDEIGSHPRVREVYLGV